MLMGMAASQARYIALTARKSNIEYEGQQINQARLALANQSANLFNQMMDVGVPTPPSTTDYTTVQYSFSDGFNTEVLSNYYQLGNADSDYNYVVTTYHNEKVYQGSRKKMNDPQIQTTWTNHYSYNPSGVDNNFSRAVEKAVLQDDGSYFIQQSDGTTKTYRPVTVKEEDQVRAINHGLGQNEENPVVNLNNDAVRNTFNIINKPTAQQLKELGSIFGYTANNTVVDQTTKVDLSDSGTQANYNPATTADLADLQKIYGDNVTDADVGNYYKGADGSYVTKADYDANNATATASILKPLTMSVNTNNKDSFIEIDTNNADLVARAKAALPADANIEDYYLFNATDVSEQGFMLKTDYETSLANGTNVNFYKVDSFDGDYYWNGTGYVTAADMNAKKETATLYLPEAEKTGIGIVESGDQKYYTDGTTFVTKADLDAAVESYSRYLETGKREPNTINEINVSNDPTFSNYTAVGNCKLTEVLAADFERDADLKAEIDQIIKDMKGPNGDMVAAENLEACFDIDSNGDYVYKGGLYSFQMGGTTYYTTENDLAASAPTSIVDNAIDVQQEKLRYYNGIYVETKVEDTQKALLETDGAGRFKSVRFENDNVAYTLNTETVTDEDAYNDAMNRYYYENAEYEKMLSDINARTEIIQAQDRTLELRLEQLQTEQSALQNEMEAVKKVVDKHVEQGFKTFGG